GAEGGQAAHARRMLLEERVALGRLVQQVGAELGLQRRHRASVAARRNDDFGLHERLNFCASASAPRARMPTSAPTATNSAPHSSQRRASASFGVRMPGALPHLRMRRIAASMSGFTLALAISPR